MPSETSSRSPGHSDNASSWPPAAFSLVPASWSLESGAWDVLTRQQRESCWSEFWHRSILDILVLEVAGDSRGELRQPVHETAQFPLQLLAILRQPIRIYVRFQVAIQVLIRVSFRRVLRQVEDLDPIRLVPQPLVHSRPLR